MRELIVVVIFGLNLSGLVVGLPSRSLPFGDSNESEGNTHNDDSFDKSQSNLIHVDECDIVDCRLQHKETLQIPLREYTEKNSESKDRQEGESDPWDDECEDQEEGECEDQERDECDPWYDECEYLKETESTTEEQECGNEEYEYGICDSE